MTTDILDRAKTIRDLALAHHEKLAADLQIHEAADAANRLGIHLTAVLLAFVADRHKTLDGVVRDDYLQRIIGGAFGMAIGNAVSNWRPVVDGAPLPASINAHLQLQRVAAETFRQVACAEQGLQDFNIQIKAEADGSLAERQFDFTKMMKGQS